MLTIRHRINQLYIKTPLFYKLYALTSGITYFYFPETLNIIIMNTGCLAISELLDVFEKYVTHYYPDKLLLCDIAFFSNIVSKIGSLGYVSGNLSTLKTLHTSIVGFGYSFNSYLLQSVISGARYSAIWGTVSSVAVWCSIKTFEKFVKSSFDDMIKLIKRECNELVTTVINRVNTESDDLRNLVLNVNGILSAPQNFIAQLGIELENSTLSGSRRVFLENQLDQIAPKRCPAFLNQMLQKSIKCSCCLEECTNKQFHRVLPCSHTFHVECLDKWLLEKTTVCPNCRTDLYPKYLEIMSNKSRNT